ncbi:MAG: hypothetical protein ACP5RM_03540 [Candidatus Micrarchaeia archaeon]
MAKATKELILSFATVVLTILAIIIFIYQQGSSAFYIIATITIIVGFVNAWLISKQAHAANPDKAAFKSAQKPRHTKLIKK